MAIPTEKSIYRFDDFRLDSDKLMLYRDGEPVKLPPKAVETLITLVRNRGEIISKDDLMSAVWKGAFVEESNLTQYLYMLRKELGTRASGSPYIQTLRKRGYLFDSDTFGIETTDIDSETGRHDQPATQPRYPYALATTAFLVIVAVVAGIWSAVNRVGSDRRAEQLNVLRLTNGIEVNDAAISPDGSYFVYNEIDGQRSRIWVQQTGQSTRHEIVPWVDRWHGAKTFTPDGQFIYFLEEEGAVTSSLFRVRTLGGTVVKVLTGIDSPISFAPNGREFAYSRRNAADSLTEIVVRQVEGNAPERILLSWQDAGATSYVAWSPDGKSVAFTAKGYFEPAVSHFIGQVDVASGTVKRLSSEPWENCYRIEWEPDGAGIYTVATREGDGYTTRRDQLYYLSIADGQSRRLTSDGSRLQLVSLSVTKDGSVLIVPFNRSSQIWSMAADGDTSTALQITTGLADGRAGIAPLADGRVAYIARTAESLNVWTMREDGSDQRQLTTEPQFVEELRASGDSRFLFFSAPNGRHNDLFRINADGSGLTQITFDRHVIDSGLSHDGKWLAYDATESSRTKGEASLWMLPVDGGRPMMLKTKECTRPHFSPNDKLLSCVRRNELISIISVEDGEVVRSFEAMPRATLHFGARWTPDGKALAYIVTEKDVSNIWIQPIDGSPPRRLTDFTVGSIYHFAFSLDGKRLYLARGTQIRDALLISRSSD